VYVDIVTSYYTFVHSFTIAFIIYLTKLYKIILILILAHISKQDKTYVIIYIDN